MIKVIYLYLLLSVFFQIQTAFSQNPGSIKFMVETKSEYRFFNQGSQLVITKKQWHLSFLDKEGIVKFSEVRPAEFLFGTDWVKLARIESVKSQSEKEVLLQVLLANGKRVTAVVRNYDQFGFKILIKSDENQVVGVRGSLSLDPVEEIYGFGEMWNGHIAQRGQAFEIWDRSGTPDECAYMPYYVSTKNYAFFLNYGGKVHFDIGKRNATELVFEAPVNYLDITLVSGNTIPATVQNFLTVEGLPARPPRWAFKPWFWLMGDPDKPGSDISTLRADHSLSMIKKLGTLDIPVGVTWFEPPWQTQRTSFIANPEFSSDLIDIIKKINALDVKVLAWTVPYTTSSSPNWREAVEKGYLVKKPGSEKDNGKVKVTQSGELEGNYYNFIDFFNPEARNWWQEQINLALDLGFKGFKPDAGQDLPDDAILYGGLIGKDVHNSYAFEYNRVYFDALKKRFGDDFLMIPRAAWKGSSSKTNFKWPGDLSTDFANNGLPSTVYSSLSLAFCGIPFLSTDIGGFDGIPDEDVWIRWAQFGAMLPGMQTLHMPWWYSETAVKHFRYLTWLHTSLVPVWMSLAHDAQRTGAPVCRPLVWSFQNDVDCWRVDDEFTVGSSILVAPILNTNPERDVYLPAGTWIDFWDEKETITGPVRISWNKGWNLEDRGKFPLFIREGAIIPMEICNDVTGFGWAESKEYLTVAIWPKKDEVTEFILEDTEGPVKITSDWKTSDAINISWDETKINYILRIHLNGEKIPAELVNSDQNSLSNKYSSIDSFRKDKNEGWFFDEATSNLWIRKNNQDKQNSITIKLKKSDN